MFYVSVKQGTTYCEDLWDHPNIGFVLAEVGGFLGSSYIAFNIILGSYISFAYDKSMMKSLYSF